jgi:hypothetical protein
MKTTFALLLALTTCCTRAQIPANYTVHEWGTFTSVQGGDGQLLPWHPFVTAELPSFVYNWGRSGYDLQPMDASFYNKGMMMTLQRLETPVMYFYSDQNLAVDVDVSFPQGTITEWYPRVSQIGPSKARTNEFESNSTMQSRAVWKQLQLLAPSTTQAGATHELIADQSSSHYFAARDVTADLVHPAYSDPTNPAGEYEKFIFYRGTGNFKTPLQADMDAANVITLKNTGSDALSHLIVVSIHEGRGTFKMLDALPAGGSVTQSALPGALPMESFQTQIGSVMESALISEGLFPDEARAMVNTWKDSWFTEEGDRVLYLLPRAWADQTLPLTLNPAPSKIVRVMVGRAEIISPNYISKLLSLMAQAKCGDEAAHKQLVLEGRKAGRFALPVWQLMDQAKAGSAMQFAALMDSAANHQTNAPAAN